MARRRLRAAVLDRLHSDDAVDAPRARRAETHELRYFGAGTALAATTIASVAGERQIPPTKALRGRPELARVRATSRRTGAGGAREQAQRHSVIAPRHRARLDGVLGAPAATGRPLNFNRARRSQLSGDTSGRRLRPSAAGEERMANSRRAAGRAAGWQHNWLSERAARVKVYKDEIRVGVKPCREPAVSPFAVSGSRRPPCLLTPWRRPTATRRLHCAPG